MLSKANGVQHSRNVVTACLAGPTFCIVRDGVTSQTTCSSNILLTNACNIGFLGLPLLDKNLEWFWVSLLSQTERHTIHALL